MLVCLRLPLSRFVIIQAILAFALAARLVGGHDARISTLKTDIQLSELNRKSGKANYRNTTNDKCQGLVI